MNIRDLNSANTLAEAIHAGNLGSVPRVHGNGFIQLDLTDRVRLHVWGDPRIPRQDVPSLIHNHIFSFDSKIIVGQLIHRTMMLMPHPEGAYTLYKAESAIPKTDQSILLSTGEKANVTITEERLLRTGEVYHFPEYAFHETVSPWPCATVIEKHGATLAQSDGLNQPLVLVPTGQLPDNSFDRYAFNPNLLWSIIYSVLGQPF
jgi:hypothetical protein